MTQKKFLRAVTIFFSALGVIALVLIIALFVQIAINRYGNRSDVVELTVPASTLEAGKYPSTPEAALAEYLRLDAEGANLSKKGKEFLLKLNPLESFYSFRLNSVGVITGYQIMKIQSVNDESNAIIEYDMVGTLEQKWPHQSEQPDKWNPCLIGA